MATARFTVPCICRNLASRFFSLRRRNAHRGCHIPSKPPCGRHSRDYLRKGERGVSRGIGSIRPIGLIISQLLEAVCPSGRAFYFRLFTKIRIRSMAILISSRPVAYEHRMKPSPEVPKALPGTQATFCSLSSLSVNSFEERP